MSSAAWASWLDRLESARSQESTLATKIRAGNTAAVGTSVFALQQTELERRERLLEQLVQDQLNALRTDQDQQLDVISKGVANLKNYSITMKDETELHVRLLNDIDEDVSRATDGLETEGARATQVARQSSNFKLYMIILVLFVILIFLLIVGGGR
ncbi:hypothetical protein P43SY_004645 [Pythium insidiosum]|uniref:t-SNARE coiled-coil homology domain-containing protein n=1 Tax=Pythium insidiosum TaxID=114742 RepID=A0AAD5LAB9_PYTIN|nr:hypothetical protein P43SY_004645 [Pythium insidiosum]